VKKQMMWMPFSLILSYIVLDYYRSAHTIKHFVQKISEIHSANEPWLRRFVADHELADRVQFLLGNQTAKRLASEIDRKLDQLCRLPIPPESATGNQIPVYIITPTYRRPDQIADLTRFAQTLMHVPNIYWLLIEDATEKSVVVARLLKKFGVRAIHLLGNVLRCRSFCEFTNPSVTSLTTTPLVDCSYTYQRATIPDGLILKYHKSSIISRTKDFKMHIKNNLLYRYANISRRILV
jgi:hypothetical protein